MLHPPDVEGELAREAAAETLVDAASLRGAHEAAASEAGGFVTIAHSLSIRFNLFLDLRLKLN